MNSVSLPVNSTLLTGLLSVDLTSLPSTVTPVRSASLLLSTNVAFSSFGVSALSSVMTFLLMVISDRSSSTRITPSSETLAVVLVLSMSPFSSITNVVSVAMV